MTSESVPQFELARPIAAAAFAALSSPLRGNSGGELGQRRRWNGSRCSACRKLRLDRRDSLRPLLFPRPLFLLFYFLVTTWPQPLASLAGDVKLMVSPTVFCVVIMFTACRMGLRVICAFGLLRLVQALSYKELTRTAHAAQGSVVIGGPIFSMPGKVIKPGSLISRSK